MLGKSAKRNRQGRRVLRPGARGEDVRHLQEALTDLGYDTGPVDGYFGLLTEAALKTFQTDYGLRTDGIAGERVYDILFEEHPRKIRTVHIVGEGESLASIAARYGVSESVIRCGNRMSSATVFPGQRLVIESKLVLGRLADLNDERGRNSMMIHHRTLSGVVLPACTVEPDLKLRIDHADDIFAFARDTSLAVYIEVNGGEEGKPFRRLIRNQRAVRKAVDALVANLGSRDAWGGVCVDTGWFKPADRVYAIRFLRDLVAGLKDLNRWLILLADVKLGRSKALGRCLSTRDASLAARLALGVQVPASRGKSESGENGRGPVVSPRALAETLSPFTGQLTGWKTLISVTSAAIRESDQWRPLPYDDVVQAFARTRIRLHRPGLRCLASSGKDREIVSEPPAWTRGKVQLINHMHLGGMMITYLGYQRDELWREIKRSLHLWRFGER